MELKTHSTEIIENKQKFEPYSEWYFIDSTGTIKNFTIQSGLSKSGAEALSGIYTVYSDWSQAKEALDKYNKVFTTFKEQI